MARTFRRAPVERQFNRNGILYVSPRRRSHRNQSGVDEMGKTKKKKKRCYRPPNLYTTTLQLHLGGSSGRGGWGAADLSILKGGTGLSLRNLVLWWDSPRLSAGTSAGRRSATVALCNGSIKPQGKFCTQPLARASTVSSQAVAHLLRTSSPRALTLP